MSITVGNLVLACFFLCRRTVSRVDVLKADTLLVKFCQHMERLYGKDSVIPNMHLHCHMAACIKDYGSVCDWICEKPACRENAQVAQCTFLVPRVENCQSPVFVIFMSRNLSTNYCCSLWRVNVSYQGKIRLYLQVPRST